MKSCDGCLGVCCVIPGTVLVDKKDIRRLAAAKDMPPSTFVEWHTVATDDGKLAIKRGIEPCPFQASTGRCSVYEARPRACREYGYCWDRKDVSYEIASRLYEAGYRSGRITARMVGPQLAVEVVGA